MKKERKLDRIYAEFEKEYSEKSKEEMEKIMSDLEKEIAGKTDALEGKSEEEKETLQKDIDSKKKRLENLRGYTKNKDQIKAIREYRASLETKLEQATADRDESLELLKQARKDFEAVSKKLADEKYTMSLDQNEYNALLEEKARAEKEKVTQAERHLKAKNRVLELEAKIGKCNLAWKSLFVNKTWDDIQRIALEPDTRFTRKVNPEKDVPISEKKREKQNSLNNEEENIKREIAESVKKIQSQKEREEIASKKESTALVEKKEGFFKRIWNRFRNWISGEEENSQTAPKSEMKEEQQAETKQQETVIKQERDAFLEGLRQHVDEEYRKSVKEEKEIQYKEAHKVQPKKEEKPEETR